MSAQSVFVKKLIAFSAVPDLLLEDRRLTLAARAVAGWMLGRPPGWIINLGHMKYTLGISDKRWTGIKKELTQLGFYSQEKKRGVSKNGKKQVWEWTHTITDAPLFDLIGRKSSIPPFSRDGLSTIPSSGDAARTGTASSDACGGDIAGVVVSTSENISANTSPPPKQNRPAEAGLGSANASVCGVVGKDVVLEMSEREKEHFTAACWQQERLGKPVVNKDRFRTWLLKRWRDGEGFNSRDHETLVAWRGQGKTSGSPDGHSGFEKVDYLSRTSRNQTRTTIGA